MIQAICAEKKKDHNTELSMVLLCSSNCISNLTLFRPGGGPVEYEVLMSQREGERWPDGAEFLNPLVNVSDSIFRVQ